MDVVEEPQPEEQIQEAPLNRETAIQKALKIALTRGSVVKGISEVLKALEAQKVKVVFLAEDCDNDQYKQTLNALAKEFKVPVLTIDSWEKLKDFCHLGLLSSTIKEIAEKKEKKVKLNQDAHLVLFLIGEKNLTLKNSLKKNLNKLINN